MPRDRSNLTEEQHLTMQELGYPDSYRLGQSEADYLLPLEHDDVSALMMAVSMLEDRASIEGDEKMVERTRTLRMRLKYDGLITSGVTEP